MKDFQNNSYQEIWDEIKKHHQITICTHINPDGDTIGTALALKHLILANLKNIDIRISGDKYPRYLNFLESNDLVDDNFFNNSLKIVVDTSSKKRIFDKRVIPSQSIKIDHHPHEETWLLEIGGDHWPAAGQIIYEMARDLNLKRSEVVDEALFVSIWTDTEGMTHRNITDATHQAINNLDINKEALLKKMELNSLEKKLLENVSINSNGIVSYSITNNFISNDVYRQYVSNIFNKINTEILIVGTKQKKYYRFGIRSHGKIDISKFANTMGGGGHLSSSGFIIDSVDPTLVKDKIYKLIERINNEQKNK